MINQDERLFFCFCFCFCLCDYGHAYIFVKGTITNTGGGDDAAARQADEKNKGVVFKNCAPFTNCKSGINNTEQIMPKILIQ